MADRDRIAPGVYLVRGNEIRWAYRNGARHGWTISYADGTWKWFPSKAAAVRSIPTCPEHPESEKES